jgi:hypothetical protein
MDDSKPYYTLPPPFLPPSSIPAAPLPGNFKRRPSMLKGPRSAPPSSATPQNRVAEADWNQFDTVMRDGGRGMRLASLPELVMEVEDEGVPMYEAPEQESGGAPTRVDEGVSEKKRVDDTRGKEVDEDLERWWEEENEAAGSSISRATSVPSYDGFDSSASRGGGEGTRKLSNAELGTSSPLL